MNKPEYLQALWPFHLVEKPLWVFDCQDIDIVVLHVLTPLLTVLINLDNYESRTHRLLTENKRAQMNMLAHRGQVLVILTAYEIRYRSFELFPCKKVETCRDKSQCKGILYKFSYPPKLCLITHHYLCTIYKFTVLKYTMYPWSL